MATEKKVAEERQITLDPAEASPFSVFTTLQKRWILFITGFAGFFSPLSSFIFYPAIVPIATGLGVTIGRINLAITTYLVVSGIVPAILGNAADKIGRRPVYIVALFIYFVANIGLALQNRYPALLVLRMVQSAGIAGTVSLGYGVISDIATPSERGSCVGIFSLGLNLGPPIGPVLGGILAAKLGWRWIFWFLVITGGSCLVMALFALPETARAIVGNGSIPATGMNRTLIPISCSSSRTRDGADKLSRDMTTKGRLASFPNPLASLKLLLELDLFILLLCNAIYYTAGACAQTSLSSLFIEVYGYKELQAGLIYIPFGLGALASVYIWGKFLDIEYSRISKGLGYDPDEVKEKLFDDFPIELTRLRSISYLAVLTAAATAGYGWTVQKQVHVAVPLLIQAVLGFTFAAGFVTFGTLTTDLNPGRSSTAAASANILRAFLAAGGTAALQPIIDAVGAGWCFTIFGFLVAACGPLLLLQIRIGPKWRESRKSRQVESDNASS
ncbi:major facilitator superfamily transporter [Xylaria curta]|nr:major facilitator superfamily transporter [Xylaria curta]